MAKNPKTVDIAVAKWKNYEPCAHCFDTPHGGYAPTLTGPEVDRIKEKLVSGMSLPEVAQDYEITPTTIRSHIHEMCDYNYLEQPQSDPIEWQKNSWEWADE